VGGVVFGLRESLTKGQNGKQGFSQRGFQNLLVKGTNLPGTTKKKKEKRYK